MSEKNAPGKFLHVVKFDHSASGRRHPNRDKNNSHFRMMMMMMMMYLPLYNGNSDDENDETDDKRQTNDDCDRQFYVNNEHFNICSAAILTIHSSINNVKNIRRLRTCSTEIYAVLRRASN